MELLIIMIILGVVLIYVYILTVLYNREKECLEQEIDCLKEIQELLFDARRLVNELTWEKIKDKKGAVDEEVGRKI